jgi:hypothetical protein
MLYFAYGSNLCVEAMKRRCPKAKKLGSFHLTHSRLVFRGVADIEYDRKESCPGGLWKITRECEKELDMYEGVGGGLYEKIYIKVKMVKTGKVADVLVCQMCHGGVQPPGQHYLDVIAQGYEDFGLDLDYLDMALIRSWNEKDQTSFLKRRRRRRKDGPAARELMAT